MENKLNERAMNKLIKELTKKGIPFEVTVQSLFNAISVLSPSIEDPAIDAICHEGSYGVENGLIEIMYHKLEVQDDVVGYLTPEEAAVCFETAYKALTE